MIPCKDCLVFPICLAFIRSEVLLIAIDAVLHIAHHKCSILRNHLYYIHPDHPEGLDSEKYHRIRDYFYNFISDK